MQHKGKFHKIVLTFFTLGFIIWLGGSIVRMTIAYDLFEPGVELVLKNWYSEAVRMQTVFIFANLGFYTGIGYGLAFLCSFCLLKKYKGALRKSGWLFMAFTLFYLSSPVELYNIYMDIKLGLGLYSGDLSFSGNAVQDYFMERITAVWFSVVRSLSLLANITAVIYLIWQPLEKEK